MVREGWRLLQNTLLQPFKNSLLRKITQVRQKYDRVNVLCTVRSNTCLSIKKSTLTYTCTAHRLSAATEATKPLAHTVCACEGDQNLFSWLPEGLVVKAAVVRERFDSAKQAHNHNPSTLPTHWWGGSSSVWGVSLVLKRPRKALVRQEQRSCQGEGEQCSGCWARIQVTLPSEWNCRWQVVSQLFGRGFPCCVLYIDNFLFVWAYSWLYSKTVYWRKWVLCVYSRLISPSAITRWSQWGLQTR